VPSLWVPTASQDTLPAGTTHSVGCPVTLAIVAENVDQVYGSAHPNDFAECGVDRVLLRPGAEDLAGKIR